MREMRRGMREEKGAAVGSGSRQEWDGRGMMEDGKWEVAVGSGGGRRQ